MTDDKLKQLQYWICFHEHHPDPKGSLVLPTISVPLLLELDWGACQELISIPLPFSWPTGYGHSAADRKHVPQLKSSENANIQPNPGLILRAEPTVTNILKVSASSLATGVIFPSFQFFLYLQINKQRPQTSLLDFMPSYLGSREREKAREGAVEN